MKAIWPISLIKRPEKVNEFPIQKRPFDSIDNSCGDGPESRVTLNQVITHFDRDIVESRCFRGPELWARDIEHKLPV